jgi:hypothetical protein
MFFGGKGGSLFPVKIREGNLARRLGWNQMAFTLQLKKLGKSIKLPLDLFHHTESSYAEGTLTKQRCSRDRLRGLLSFEEYFLGMIGY